VSVLKLSKYLENICSPYLVRKANIWFSFKSIASYNRQRNCRALVRGSGLGKRRGLVEADGKVVSELAPARQEREPLRCSNQFLPVRNVLWPLSPQSYKNVSVTTTFLRSPKSVIFFFRSDPL